jgi:hypothetical protein
MQAEISLRVVGATLQHKHQGAPNAKAILLQPMRQQWTFTETTSVYMLSMYVNTDGNAMEQTTKYFVLLWHKEMMRW